MCTAESAPYALPLARYLKDRVAPDCVYHHGPEYSATFRADDLMVCEATKDLTERILSEAESEHELRAPDVACDFSSCPRNMALGMILACLDGRRDVQFVGTDYDEAGNPTGGLFPIVYRFHPAFGVG